jgi:dimethylamine/trimethylamine dehydrogenase
MGEEWRRGWHPENLPKKKSDQSFLIIGAGPAGLEAAHALGKRGYKVILSEERNELGGRVTLESRLPTLSEWARVKDYREQQFLKLPNVEVYLNSKITVEDILLTEADHIVIATGAKWRDDGFGRSNEIGINNLKNSNSIFTPDDIMAGHLPKGQVVIFDDDYYYMGPVIAELLQKAGCNVTFITTSDMVCSFGNYTSEQPSAQKNLINLGIKLIFSQNINSYNGKDLELSCMYTDRKSRLKADSVVMITARLPIDILYYQLQNLIESKKNNSIKSISRIGDSEAPAPIASAVYAGRKYALKIDDNSSTDYSARRDTNYID